MYPCEYGNPPHAGSCTAPLVPSIEGSFAPKGPRHAHRMRTISLTLDGPLRVLLSCADCAKVEVVAYTPRLRKVREGFTPESWAKFMEMGAQRLKEAA